MYYDAILLSHHHAFHISPEVKKNKNCDLKFAHVYVYNIVIGCCRFISIQKSILSNVAST